MIDEKSFQCHRCGACCRIEGIVRLEEGDAMRIAMALGITEEKFIDEFTDIAPDRKGLVLKDAANGACILLTPDNLCRANEVKPRKCKTFPFEWTNKTSAEYCPALQMTPVDLAGLVDHTYLKPFGDVAAIDRLCAEAAEYHFASVAVNGYEVARCAAALRGTGVKVTAVAGFPLGQMTPEAKLFEVRDVIAKGAGEVDIVQNVRALQNGDWKLVLDELTEFARICRDVGVVSKVIFENCYLTEEQKILSCKCACEAGVDFVKTSTGFGSGGATVNDVALMRKQVGPEKGVKAAGGIRDLAAAQAMIRAGATRIGTSAGVEIMKEFALRVNCGGVA